MAVLRDGLSESVVRGVGLRRGGSQGGELVGFDFGDERVKGGVSGSSVSGIQLSAETVGEVFEYGNGIADRDPVGLERGQAEEDDIGWLIAGGNRLDGIVGTLPGENGGGGLGLLALGILLVHSGFWQNRTSSKSIGGEPFFSASRRKKLLRSFLVTVSPVNRSECRVSRVSMAWTRSKGANPVWTRRRSVSSQRGTLARFLT